MVLCHAQGIDKAPVLTIEMFVMCQICEVFTRFTRDLDRPDHDHGMFSCEKTCEPLTKKMKTS